MSIDVNKGEETMEERLNRLYSNVGIDEIKRYAVPYEEYEDGR